MSNFNDRAAAIIEAAQAKAAQDLRDWIENVLPNLIRLVPADERDKFLRDRAAELRQWRESNYRRWLDLPKYGPDKITRWLCALMRDETDGYQTEIPTDKTAVILMANWLKNDGIITHIVKLLNETPPKPKEKQIFGDDLAAIIRQALAQLSLLSDTGAFIGKKYQVKALYQVLIQRGYILGDAKEPEETFAAFFKQYFQFGVSGRTLRADETRGQAESHKDFLLIIPKK